MTVRKRHIRRQKHDSYVKGIKTMPKVWQLEKGIKLKNGDVAKPVKNTPSQDGTEGEQGAGDLIYSQEKEYKEKIKSLNRE